MPVIPLTALLLWILLQPVPGMAGQEGYGVHLASYRSPERAESGWDVLVRNHPDELAGMTHVVVKVDLGPDKGVYHRLMAGPFTDRIQAERLMHSLALRGAECSVKPLPQSVIQEFARSVPQARELSEQVAPAADSPSMGQEPVQDQDERPVHSAWTSGQESAEHRPVLLEYPAQEGPPNPYDVTDPPHKPLGGPVLVSEEVNDRVRSEFGASPTMNGSGPGVEAFTRLRIDMGDYSLRPQLNISTTGEVMPFAGISIPF